MAPSVKPAVRQITFGKNQQTISHEDDGRTSPNLLGATSSNSQGKYLDQMSYVLRDADNLQFDVKAMQTATKYSPDALHAAQQYQKDLSQLQTDNANAYSATGGNSDEQAYLAQIINYTDGLSQGEKDLTTYNLQSQDNPVSFNSAIDSTLNNIKTVNGANPNLESLDQNRSAHIMRGKNVAITGDVNETFPQDNYDGLHDHILG